MGEMCLYQCACVLVNANLKQQEAGQVTGVGGLFALERNDIPITTEFWPFDICDI